MEILTPSYLAPIVEDICFQYNDGAYTPICIEVIHSVNIMYFLSGKRRRSRSLLLGGQRFGFLSIQNDIKISCFVHNTTRVLFFCS